MLLMMEWFNDIIYRLLRYQWRLKNRVVENKSKLHEEINIEQFTYTSKN